MVFNTLTVGAAIAPSVIETYFSHYLNRKRLHQKPTAHISYHEGLRLLREFLNYSSHHTVDEIQAFTAQWVPSPRWVKTDEFPIPEAHLVKSAELIQAQLGPRGIDRVGGKTWWQWRISPLRAEWIEMRNDYDARKANGDKGQRIILYVHGGAYYFSSVDTHRSQMQRHARKLKARLLAPRYRLAPQFGFPCGLYDCVAAYLYLLTEYDPSSILFGGDSAGGGMVLAMLVTLRDQGIPLPAGAFLLSPWVDLTHSFPSVAGDDTFDYVPNCGFIHKPCASWPPPSSIDMKDLAQYAAKADWEERTVNNPLAASRDPSAEGFRSGNTLPGSAGDPSIMLDGKLIEIHDQIQMYTTNQLIGHPLVSPVLQPSLGGLPPLLIQVGGGELLRDEQIYLAHKAANPAAYPPGEAFLDEYDPDRTLLKKYEPTDVQLQVWDDLCHVTHTLSFTRPAKYMFRGVAQFGAWALAHAQKRNVTILDDDNISVISTDTTDEEDDEPTPRTAAVNADSATPSHGDTGDDLEVTAETKSTANRRRAASTAMHANDITTPSGCVGLAGDPLPPFKNHMIRQRVDRHGQTYPLQAPASLPALNLDPASIGVIKPIPVRRYLAKKERWDAKFASQMKAVRKQRLKEMAAGYEGFGAGEKPPPAALAGRRTKDMKGYYKAEQKRGKKSFGITMWSGWGSSHDESTIEREQRAGPVRRESVARPKAGDGSTVMRTTDEAAAASGENAASTTPIDERNRGDQSGELYAAASLFDGTSSSTTTVAAAAISTLPALQGNLVPGSENTFISPTSTRPHNGTVAYPFKLRSELMSDNASTATLHSQATSEDQIPPMADRLAAGASGLASESRPQSESELVSGSENTFIPSTSTRPYNGTITYPFKLRSELMSANASTATLHSQATSEDQTSPTADRLDADESGLATERILQSEGEMAAVGALPVSSDSGGGGGNGQLAQRPVLESFVTAREGL